MPVPGSASTSETIAASIGSETAGDAAFASRSLNVSALASLSVPSALAVSAHDDYATLTSGGTRSISTYASFFVAFALHLRLLLLLE